MKISLTQKEWLKLSKDLRQQLIFAFMINKSEGMRVVDSEIVSDGCSQEDLMNGVTITKMIQLLGNNWKKVDNDELFDYLFNLSIDKITNKTNESSKEDVKDVVPQQANTSPEGGGEKVADTAGEGKKGARGKGKVSPK